MNNTTDSTTDAMYRYPYQYPNQGCPSCGYCPHCGRSNPQISPQIPPPYCGPSTMLYSNPLEWQIQAGQAAQQSQQAQCNQPSLQSSLQSYQQVNYCNSGNTLL